MDYSTLEKMRQSHPGWRLLCADQSALVASFLHRVFIVPNKRYVIQGELVEALDDELYVLRERLGAKAFPRSPLEYLNDWAANDKGWLRKYYKPGTDEPFFDLTPATEKAIGWLSGLTERSFVGTESRLLTLFNLLDQICSGTQSDPEIRISELKRKQAEIEAEIESINVNGVSLLDDTAIKERFMQFESVARELLGDFREVENNFRQLDRSVREQIAMREEGAGKGSVLEDIMGKRDEISESDQGRSFRGFWDFLISNRQEEFSNLLEQVWAIPAVSSLEPDPRLKKVHYDWLEAGENTQRTVAMLSNQLRRFLDDAAWLENRRIMEVLKQIEQKALSLRQKDTTPFSTEIDTPNVVIELPFERPLYKPTSKVKLVTNKVKLDDQNIEAEALFDRTYVDSAALAKHIKKVLVAKGSATLSEIVTERPLTFGLSELVAYLQLATTRFECIFSESECETIEWTGDDGIERQAEAPLVTFLRQK